MTGQQATILTATDGNFDAEITSAAGLVVVDFWATWCAPCRMIAPIIDQLAHEYAGQATFAKLDTDSNPKTMVRFGVRNLPSILLFRDGVLVDRVIGAVPKPTLEQRIRAHL